METTKIGIIEGRNGVVLRTIGEAARELEEYNIEVVARHPANEIEDEFWQWLRNEADAIFLYINKNDESFEIIKEVASDANVPVFSIGSEMQLANVPPDVLVRAQQYRVCGGVNNIKNLLLFMAQHCRKSTVEPAPPEEMPWDGIYHPDAGCTYESLGDYNKWYQKKGDHTAGILFHRTGWLEGDTLVCDALVREFENNGINVIPVFSHGFENVDLGIDGNDAVLNKYLMVDGASVINILINLKMFFLFPRNEVSDHSTSGADILKRLNVPVIQGVTSYYRTEKEWRDSGDGLDPIGLVINVAMPEFDGTVEPTFIGAIERVDEPTTGALYNRHVPVMEQIRFLVSRAVRWIHLKDIPNSERKVALILLNSPCKGVEATIGTAFGLDSLESVVRILHRMKEEGYDLGDNIPASGEDLIHEILEKKAISEFRWTPMSEIVKKGGSFMLSRDRYLEWFSEFPDRVKRELIGTWGDPRSDFSNKGKAALSEPDLEE
mgnify:CR=1 FL=1